MLLIIASALDHQATALAGRWARRHVVVATPRDLSRPGWRLRVGRPQHARAAIGARIVAADELDAVVSLLPWIAAPELGHIVEEDRAYVANEMGAFLLAWLTELRCPVIDRPSPSSLAGCGRWPGEWASVATSLGIKASPGWTGETMDVTVVGGCAVDDDATTPRTRRAAAALATAAGRNLVTLQFKAHAAEPVLVGALPRANAGAPAVADALLDWLDAA